MSSTQNIVVKANQPNSFTFNYSGATAGNTPLARIRRRKSGTIIQTFFNTVTFGGGNVVWNVMNVQASTANFPAYYEIIVREADGTDVTIWEGYALLSVPRVPIGGDGGGGGGTVDQEQLDAIYSSMGVEVGKTTLVNGKLTSTFTTHWGLRADGTGYYDPNGVPDSDSAALVPSDEGGLKLIPLARTVAISDSEFKVRSAPYIKTASQYIGAFGTSEEEGYIVSPVANELHLIPIYLPSANTTIEAIALRVTKSAPGARLRVAIYETTNSGADVFNKRYDPTLSLTIDASTVGVKEVNFATPLDRLPPLVYIGVDVQGLSEGYAKPEFAGIRGNIIGSSSNDPFARGLAFVTEASGSLPKTVGVSGSVLPVTNKSINVLLRVRG